MIVHKLDMYAYVFHQSTFAQCYDRSSTSTTDLAVNDQRDQAVYTGKLVRSRFWGRISGI